MAGLTYTFFITSALLALGLGMDAFTVSIANGLSEPDMSGGKAIRMASTYAVFQFVMPMIGWILVHTAVTAFDPIQKYIPYAAFILLLFIGGKMLIDGIKNLKTENVTGHVLSGNELFIQGLATSIDALSVGFTIATYGVFEALLAAAIIGVITFLMCLIGEKIGEKFGMKLAGRATILGGLILILIGLHILVDGIKK